MRAGTKSSEEKRLRQKETLKNTRNKRKSQICKVYALKIDESHLNIIQKQWLWKLFIEARWFYNHILQQIDVFDTKVRKNKSVQVKVLDHFEGRKLEVLSSQMRLGLHEQVCEAIKALSILKKKSFKIGRLKFKSEINAINLPQYKITWNIQNGRIRIQGLKKTLPVSGLDQIPKNIEFANAEIVRKPSGYYIHVTTFQLKQERIHTGKEVGLDFGIKDNIVTSDGEKFNVKILESKKLKRFQKRFSKKIKGSKQAKKVNYKIKREYERIGNQKKDKVNKIVSHLVKEYDTIYIQDEMIKQWHSGLFGKQVQNSALGAIKARLKNLESIRIISRSFPTTKMCYNCGMVHKPIPLSQRIFKCDCGLEEDRDIKAAKTILKVGRLKFPVMEHNSTPLEIETSAQIGSNFNLSKFLSLKEEAPQSLVVG